MINLQSLKDTVDDELFRMYAHSVSASMAIMMIIAHESQKGRYWQQVNGPAKGLIQMEPATHDDTWKHCDSIQQRAAQLGITQDVHKLEHDIRYNIFMARCRLLMDVNPLPATEEAMAEYLKSYWNSDGGKASASKYLNEYREWKLGI